MSESILTTEQLIKNLEDATAYYQYYLSEKGQDEMVRAGKRHLTAPLKAFWKRRIEYVKAELNARSGELPELLRQTSEGSYLFTGSSYPLIHDQNGRPLDYEFTEGGPNEANIRMDTVWVNIRRDLDGVNVSLHAVGAWLPALGYVYADFNAASALEAAQVART